MIVVYCPCKNKEEAEKIADALITEKLAVCVNIIPEIKSVYRWKGVKEKSPEAVMFIKTRKDLFGRVSKMIEELHSYDSPIIFAIPVLLQSGKTAKYLKKELK